MSDIDVAPVSGMAPEVIATELRLLIRDKIWHGLREGSNAGGVDPDQFQSNSSQFDNRRQRAVENLQEIRRALDELDELAKRRKPAEIKAWAVKTRLYIQRVESGVEGMRTYGRWAFSQVSSGGANFAESLSKDAERAYALVQGLPTIQNPTIGKAENTIRAITAILKVYYGLDVEATAEQLPEVMHDLLESIGRAKMETAPGPVEELEVID